MDKKYKLLAIIGKSGSGKDSLFNAITLNPTYKPDGIHRVIGITTRPMREGEENGKDYHFISPSDFYVLDQTNNLFGISNFRGWLYGTSYDELKEDKINIGIFDPDRINDILENEKDIELKVANIIVMDKERLIRQLNRELNPDIDEIIRRYQAEKSEWDRCKFDTIPIFNNTATDWQNSIYKLREIIAAWGQE